MKHVATAVILIVLLLLPVPALIAEPRPGSRLVIEISDKAADPPPANQTAKTEPSIVKAESAILVDAVTGQILFEKNARQRRPMASATKIMTAMLIIENCGMNDIVVAGKKACETNNSSLHLKPGERLTVRNLLYGILIRSANDACVAGAERVAGTSGRFIKMMNDKAKAMGALDTHFVNPHGLYQANHYSTAYDLALIARGAIRYPVFNEIVKTQKYVLERSKNKNDLVLFNQSKFLKNYAGADGIKSGYTKQSGRCYVGSATRDGWRLISVVLKSPNVSQETAALMDYGFGSFKRVAVVSKGRAAGSAVVNSGVSRTVPAVAAADLYAVAPAAGRPKVTSRIELEEVSAPVRRGQKLGRMTAYVDGRPAAEVILTAAADVEPSVLALFFPWARNGLILLIGLMVGKRYGTAVAKGAGGVGTRFAQEMRRPDRRR